MTRLILLDRDGVINEDTATGVLKQKDFQFIEGALEALKKLADKGFNIAVVTNQSAVGKGWMSEEVLGEIHRAMCDEITYAGGKIDKIYYCTDHPDAPTHRRKPNPGMIEEALADFDAVPQDALLIGDALRDLQAAAALGVPKVLVKTGKGGELIVKGIPEHVQPVEVYENILAVAEAICQR